MHLLPGTERGHCRRTAGGRGHLPALPPPPPATAPVLPQLLLLHGPRLRFRLPDRVALASGRPAAAGAGCLVQERPEQGPAAERLAPYRHPASAFDEAGALRSIKSRLRRQNPSEPDSQVCSNPRLGARSSAPTDRSGTARRDDQAKNSPCVLPPPPAGTATDPAPPYGTAIESCVQHELHNLHHLMQTNSHALIRRAPLPALGRHGTALPEQHRRLLHNCFNHLWLGRRNSRLPNYRIRRHKDGG